MHRDPDHVPTDFTHAEWMATKDALFAVKGVENEVAKAMNLMQRYYGELMNTVGNKGRNVAELIAACLDGGSATSGGHVGLNTRIAPRGKRAGTLTERLETGKFVPGRVFDEATLVLLRRLQRLCNPASHPKGMPPVDRVPVVHAVYALAKQLEPTTATGEGEPLEALLEELGITLGDVNRIMKAAAAAKPRLQILSRPAPGLGPDEPDWHTEDFHEVRCLRALS